MTEAWLAENGIGTEAIGLARVLGFTWLGIVVVLIRTFISGPAGTSAFFMALVIAQIGIFLNLWHQELMGALEVDHGRRHYRHRTDCPAAVRLVAHSLQDLNKTR